MIDHLRNTLRIVHECKNYNAWLYSQITPHVEGVVLDIGSGLGTITQYLNNNIKELILSDLESSDEMYLPSDVSLSDNRRILLNIAGTDLTLTQQASWVDTITCINVLEHIHDDQKALVNMNYLLKKGGRAVVLVPALQSVYGTLDEQLGHVRRYSGQQLALLLEKADFKVETWHYMNFFGIFSWFIAGRILKQRTFNRRVCTLLDQSVPLIRALESVFPPFLGQSLIIVGRKN